MVPKTIFVATLALAFSAPHYASAQDASISGFRPETRKDGLATPRTAAKDNAVSPELRGDIYMARKMFREAVEMYQSAPESAITLNKTGIAYHQMLQFDTAKKYYERASKLDRKYPEAVNNLGTV